MYSLQELLRGFRNPSLILREMNRFYYTRLNIRDFYHEGDDIFAEDWDNLILLDACRYDIFKQVCDLSGELEHRVSRGSQTVEFLRGNFSSRKLMDTVYVTANPQLYRHRDQIGAELYKEINVWEEDGWDEKYETVLPETTTNFAIRAAENHPNKRLIVHYIQPHYPFITTRTEFDKDHLQHNDPEDRPFWAKLRTNDLNIDMGDVWELYRENLELAIEEVERLTESLNGKTIISSDHGNLFNERLSPLPVRDWGHPQGMHVEKLLKVPWFICEYNGRKEIVDEEPKEGENAIEESDVRERLKQLGYTE